MSPHRRPARTAGALYLVIILAGLSAELIWRGPAIQSLSTGVQEPAFLVSAFRLSALADLTMLVADVTLALVFYTLLRPVSERLAHTAMVFA